MTGGLPSQSQDTRWTVGGARGDAGAVGRGQASETRAVGHNSGGRDAPGDARSRAGQGHYYK